MSPGVLFGLGAALCWGTADFFGGLQSRRLPALTVVFWSQLSGGVGAWVVLLASGTPVVLAALAWGMGAGVCAGLALLCFYRGLAVGTMSIVAPIAASGAILPVLVAAARGEMPGLLAGLGVVVALIGVVLLSLQPDAASHPAARPRLALALALAAATGFGAFFILVDEGAALGPALVVAAGTRSASVPMLLLIGLLSRRGITWPGPQIAPISAIGLADVSANALFAFASTLGNLGVVSVLASLYPVAPVLLGRFLLDERLSGLQAVGVVLALGGVVLMSTG